MELGPCTYCGFCEWFGCGNYSKASPQTTLLPALLRKPNFTARTGCEVTRINLDKSGKHATGVTFVDSSGDEWEQPAELVILCGFQLWNVQLLMLSEIGRIYDPNTGEGQIGRNFSPPDDFDRARLLRQARNTSLTRLFASGAIGMCIDEFNGDNFDHGPHGFVGGGYMGQVQTSGRPIDSLKALPADIPTWGKEMEARPCGIII